MRRSIRRNPVTASVVSLVVVGLAVSALLVGSNPFSPVSHTTCGYGYGFEPGSGYGYGTGRQPFPDDADPAVTIEAASADEAAGVITFTVRLSGANCDETVTVTATTMEPAGNEVGTGGESPATAGSDYTTTSSTVTFAPGETAKPFSVPITDDAADEPNEFFRVQLSAPVNATLGTPSSAQGTIIDNDGNPALTINDASAIESAGTLTMTVTLSPASSGTVTVEAATLDVTAVDDEDYEGGQTTVTFAPGETTKTITVILIDDSVDEPDETFTVNLFNPSGATIADAQGVGTILDDDGPGIGSAPLGYRMVAADGGVFVFGERGFFGSLGDIRLNKPIVGGATNLATYNGYWMVASDGGVFNFGDAGFFGSMGSATLDSPIVEIEPTPSGQGYFLVDARGRVFPFGDAVRGIGDARNLALNQAIIGMSVTSSGQGYWLVGADGGIFTFGDAQFFGSTGNLALTRPIIDLAPTTDSGGYYLLGQDGGVFAFGNAEFKGSTGNMVLNRPAVAMLVTPNGAGYWFMASDGGVFSFGPIPFFGSTGDIRLNSPVLDAIH